MNMLRTILSIVFPLSRRDHDPDGDTSERT